MHLHCDYKHYSPEYNKEDKVYNWVQMQLKFERKQLTFK